MKNTKAELAKSRKQNRAYEKARGKVPHWGLLPYRDRHKGQTLWMFGKGPSLDAFDFEMAGPLRLCINESVLAIPRPTYFYAWHGYVILDMGETIPQTCTLLLNVSGGAQRFHEAQLARPTIYFNYGRGPLDLDYMIAHNELKVMPGSATAAVQFCAICGISRIVFVGFDGVGGIARRIWPHSRRFCGKLHKMTGEELSEKTKTVSRTDHKQSRRRLEALCKTFKIKTVFFKE